MFLLSVSPYSIVQKDYGAALKDGQDSKGQRWVLNVSFHRSKDKQQNQPDILWEVKRDITAVQIYAVNVSELTFTYFRY